MLVFYVGRRVLGEWDVRGGGLDGYLREQGLPVGIHECLERFHPSALTISAGSLLQNGTVRIVKANWRRRLQHRCGWNFLQSADHGNSRYTRLLRETEEVQAEGRQPDQYGSRNFGLWWGWLLVAVIMDCHCTTCKFS